MNNVLINMFRERDKTIRKLATMNKKLIKLLQKHNIDWQKELKDD